MRQIAGISRDLPNIDDLLLANRRAGQSFGKREGGMLRRAGPAPGYIPHQAGCVINIVQADPTVISRTPNERPLAIANRQNNIFQRRQKLIHFFKIAGSLLP